MIHINRGGGNYEWITEKQFKEKYPDLWREIHEASDEDEKYGKILKNKRIKNRITIREIAKKMNLKPSEVCEIQRRPSMFSGEIIDKFIMACQ